MYPSDYPHERPTLEEFLTDIPSFRARKDLSDERQKTDSTRQLHRLLLLKVVQIETKHREFDQSRRSTSRQLRGYSSKRWSDLFETGKVSMR